MYGDHDSSIRASCQHPTAPVPFPAGVTGFLEARQGGTIVSTDHQSASSLSSEDVAALAKVAGLTISEARMSLITHELNVANQAADDLLAFPDTDVSGVSGPFDPAWPEVKRSAK